MDKNIIDGNLKVLRGKLHEQWGLIIGDELEAADGRLEMLAGRIQARYGVSEEEVERSLTEWEKQLTQ